MKNAYELLLDAPDAQVKRCQLAFKAIAAGEWQDAAGFLRNAAKEEGSTLWANEAIALADACQKRVNPHRLVAPNEKAARYGGANLA